MKTVEHALRVALRFYHNRRFRRDQSFTAPQTRRQNRCYGWAEENGFVFAEEHEAELFERNKDDCLDFAAAETVSSLLDDESFLAKILGELVDDGLQECRLVCRKWRQVCDALPVKLAVLSRSDVRKVPATFPHTTTLALHAYSSGTRADDASLRGIRPEERWFEALTKLTELRSLTVRTMCASDGLFCGTAASFLPLVQLQSLAITAIGDLDVDHLFLGIRLMTNLTCLRLTAKSVWKRPTTAEPVVEIQNLKELELSENLFSNRAGQLMFPRLAHLTHLGFADRPRFLPKVRELCGKSLQSLRIGSCDDSGSTVTDWAVLLQFSVLRDLVFDDVSNRTGVVEGIVGDMTLLTSLRVNGASFGERRTMRMLASLTGLRSLCYLPPDGLTPSITDAYAMHICHLTQLTGLTTMLYREHFPFHSLTSLVELDLLVTVKLDLSDVVSRMTLLETLKVVNRRQPCLETPSVLRNLRHLKSATLEMPNDVSRDFFPALASLPGLTFLQFNCRNHEGSVPFLSDVSQVSNLKKLSVEQVVVAHPLRFLQRGTLPRLRSLRIQPFPDLEETREELRRRFPCLGKITP